MSDEALHGPMSPYLQNEKATMSFGMLTSANIKKVKVCLNHELFYCVRLVLKRKNFNVSEHINNWSLVSVLQYPLKV